jgi:hypothetical protein
MTHGPHAIHRLWRMRRRHDHIDATLAAAGAAWELTYLRNDRTMLAWRYPDEVDARRDADTRRRELERAGWVSHW